MSDFHALDVLTANDQQSGKKLFIRFIAHAFHELLSIYAYTSFVFWFSEWNIRSDYIGS